MLLSDKILDRYRQNLSIYKDVVGEFIDPVVVPPDTVKNMIQTEMIIEKKRAGMDFTPEDNLELLDRLERWYADLKVVFPNPEWLGRRRAHFLEMIQK
jgi:hypothetical protein